MAGPYPKNQVFTGARARLYIHEKPMGFATNCSGSSTYEMVPVRVLDNIEVVEHVVVSYDVSFNAARVRLIARSLKSGEFDIMPKIGVNAQAHLENVMNMGTNGEYAATLEDSITNDPFMQLTGVKFAGNNWSVAQGSIVGEDIDFVARRMRDETGE